MSCDLQGIPMKTDSGISSDMLKARIEWKHSPSSKRKKKRKKKKLPT